MEVRFKVGNKLQQRFIPYNFKFGQVLKCMAGHWFEVETEFLFSDQFNIKGISQAKAEVLAKRVKAQYRAEVIKSLVMGIRAFDSYCSVIVDDARKGRKLCYWCHHHSPVNAKKCVHCERGNHFAKPF